GVNTNGAFSDCYNLVEVVSLGNALTTIGAFAFMDCYDLTTVKATAVNSVGKYSFSGCSKLVTFGDTVNELNFDAMVKVGAGAFMDNRFDRVILKNVENIGEYSFFTSSNTMQYLARGNKQGIVVENEYTTK
ncbi:MAG: leucine-rich repeat protein, partial [Clostridia bacterium]|nr:leucine-rich repeat protein [Clostridia bacterium]